MSEPLSHIVRDNVEGIVQQYYGAEDATATVEEEHDDPKQFMLEVTFEGSLQRTDEVFVDRWSTDDYVQYVKILHEVNDFLALASYTMIPIPHDDMSTAEAIRQAKE